MSKLSFIDKLKVLFDVTLSSKMFILILVFILFLGIMFYTTNKKNKKNTKIIYISCLIFIILYLVVVYHSSLANMIDYMMNNFFIMVYFPNLAIYVAALIATNIILVVSIFNEKINKLIKNINITVYCIINYILALILSTISKNNLDVFSTESIYSNKNAQALIELSSVIFIVWILFLIIYKIIMTYLKKGKEEPVKKVVVKKKVKVLPENISEVKSPMYAKKGYNKGKKILPDNISEVKSPIYVKKEYKKQLVERPTIEPLTKEDKIVKELSNNLTLDDYKVLLKMLNNKKNKKNHK